MKKVLLCSIVLMYVIADAPQWIDGIGLKPMEGVGFARYSKVSPQFTRDIAMMNAKADLARKIRSKIKAVWSESQFESGIDVRVAKNIQEKLAQEIVDLTLKQCAPKKVYRGEEGMYMLIECKAYEQGIRKEVEQVLRHDLDFHRNSQEFLKKMVDRVTNAVVEEKSI